LGTITITITTSTFAALLNVSLNFPKVTYANTATNALTYNATSQLFSFSATPGTVQFTGAETPRLITGTRTLTVRALVNNSGNLVSGVAGDDLVLSGTVTRIVGTVTNTYSGLLLTAEVTAFGFLEAGATDQYDFRFIATGGALSNFFTCDYTVVQVTSSASTFSNSFTVNFAGRAQGMVGLEDVTPPVINCPFPSINVTNVQCSAQGGQDGAYVTFPEPTATDNCDTNALISCSPTNGSFFALAPGTNMTTHIVTCTARDASGNTNSCTFDVTIEDVLPPDFNNNSVIDACDAQNPYVLTNDTGQCYSTFTFVKPTAMDSCCTSSVPVSVSAIDENGFIISLTEFTTNGVDYVSGQFPVTCVRSNVITSTANDGRGNSAQHQCPVFVLDTEPPMIACPSNQTVGCTNGPVFYMGPTASDNCTNLTVSCTPTNGSFLAVGMYTVTCLATDGCGGNTNSCFFMLNVVDATPPAISCPTNVTVECGQSTDPSSIGTATATDNCDSNPTVTHSDATSGTCTQTITRTWFATDNASNTTQCVQIITVKDTVAPTITACPTNQTVQCDADVPPVNTALVSASDACSSVTIAHAGDVVTGTCPKTVTRTYTAKDVCGNTASCVQTITVNDTTKPTITCPATVTTNTAASVCYATGVVLGGATASDNCSSNVTVVSNAPTQFVKGTNSVVWTATDSCNNSSTCTQKVIVVDNQKPVLSGCPSNLTVQCYSAVPAAATVTASDNCDPSVVVNFSVTQSNPGSSCNNTITRTWTATDSSGNTASCSQTITVNDATKPVLSGVPAAATYFCLSAVPAAPTVTATDNCGGSVTVSYNQTQSNPGSSCNNTITRTWTATDSCGNTTTSNQVIIVNDIIPPSITSFPSNMAVACASAVPTASTNAMSATDNCGAVTVAFTPDVISNQTCPNNYTITRTYRVTDICGNTTSSNQTILVNNTQMPVFSGCTNQVTYQQQVVTNATTCIDANFNGTPISAGNWVWFNGVFKAQGTNTTYTIKVTAQTITGTIGTSNVTISVPDSQITISSAYTNATTTFTAGKWVTTAPLGLGGNTFLSGGAYQLPFSSPGAGNLSWCGKFSATPGISVSWQWAAAVYTSFTGSYGSLGVKPVDDNSASSYKNSHHAGTPENYTQYVTGGARGGGGSNFTGSYSGTKVANVSSTPTCVNGAVQYTSPTATDTCGDTPDVTCKPSPGTGFVNGSTNITCTVVDNCGNTNTCGFTVTVVPPPPAITCPGNITTNTTATSCSQTVSWTATASSSCGGTVTTTCTPASGSTFAKGTTPVTCTATETGGGTASCSFTVTVNDTTKPTITCPANKTTNTCASTAIVTYAAPTVSDNCPGVTSSCTPTNGSTFAQGTSTVTCTARDASSNTASCSFTVIVTKTAPSVPSGLQATAGYGKVTLTWSASTGTAPVTYNVKRSTTSGGPYTTVASGITTLSYTNTGLTKGVYYYFVITATNCAGTSSNSSQVYATPY
jgi:uncharacterized protein affecting Mg2+/Co2+ transport